MATFRDSVLLGTVVIGSVSTALLFQKAALGLLLDVIGAAVDAGNKKVASSSRHVREADPERVIGAEEKRLDGLG